MTPYTVVVAVDDSDEARRFLMVRHIERGWELPGGKLEEKEGPVRCALREFKEETGHLLEQPQFVLKLEKENGTCYVFTGRLGPAVQEVPSDELVQGMKWFDRLPPVDMLAFPEDPYDEIGEALGIRFR